MDVHENKPDNPAIAELGRLLNGIGEFPVVVKLLETQGREISAIKQEIRNLGRPTEASAVEGWLDARGAAIYLSMSPGTFDKYRYQTDVKIKGYKVGGKTLYKKADLDAFVMLFGVKSQGLA